MREQTYTITHRRIFLGMMEWAAILLLIIAGLAWVGLSFAEVFSKIANAVLALSFSFFLLAAGLRFTLSIVDWFEARGKKNG